MPGSPSQPEASGSQRQRLRLCRSCYGHLAGQIGVTVTRALQDHDYIRPAAQRQFIVTPAGARWFEGIGVDVSSVRPTRGVLARQCLDGTEHIHHLAGPLGTRLLQVLCADGWLRRDGSSRIITVTAKGRTRLEQTLGVITAAAKPSQP